MMFGTKKVLNEKLYRSKKPEKHVPAHEWKEDNTWTFMQFITKLLPPSSDLDGCEMVLKFPESVFFDTGKPNFLAMTDKVDQKLKK